MITIDLSAACRKPKSTFLYNLENGLLEHVYEVGGCEAVATTGGWDHQPDNAHAQSKLDIEYQSDSVFYAIGPRHRLHDYCMSLWGRAMLTGKVLDHAITEIRHLLKELGHEED